VDRKVFETCPVLLTLTLEHCHRGRLGWQESPRGWRELAMPGRPFNPTV